VVEVVDYSSLSCYFGEASIDGEASLAALLAIKRMPLVEVL
jgi:hypothetical protein